MEAWSAEKMAKALTKSLVSFMMLSPQGNYIFCMSFFVCLLFHPKVQNAKAFNTCLTYSSKINA
jgi:hypothetical protein